MTKDDEFDLKIKSEVAKGELKGGLGMEKENDTDIIRTTRIWTLGGFIRNKNSVNIGDKIALPAFKVSSAMIGGKNKMKFKKHEIEADYANVIDIRDNDIVLVFDHCLFANPMDYNNAKDFEQTQLAKYLQKDFSNAMRNSGIPVKSCTLLSYEQLFSNDRIHCLQENKKF